MCPLQAPAPFWVGGKVLWLLFAKGAQWVCGGVSEISVRFQKAYVTSPITHSNLLTWRLNRRMVVCYAAMLVTPASIPRNSSGVILSWPVLCSGSVQADLFGLKPIRIVRLGEGPIDLDQLVFPPAPLFGGT